DPPTAASIILAAARGLRSAYDAGIVHRDVKPANILVCHDGRVKVADFGVAKLKNDPRQPTGDQITMAGAVVGTPAYIAPEQAEGEEITGKADVFALGIAFYELMTNS